MCFATGNAVVPPASFLPDFKWTSAVLPLTRHLKSVTVSFIAVLLDLERIIYSALTSTINHPWQLSETDKCVWNYNNFFDLEITQFDFWQ